MITQIVLHGPWLWQGGAAAVAGRSPGVAVGPAVSKAQCVSLEWGSGLPPGLLSRSKTLGDKGAAGPRGCAERCSSLLEAADSPAGGQSGVGWLPWACVLF